VFVDQGDAGSVYKDRNWILSV